MAGMIYAMPGMQSTLHAVLDRPVDYARAIRPTTAAPASPTCASASAGVAEQQFAGWVSAGEGERPGARHRQLSRSS